MMNIKKTTSVAAAIVCGFWLSLAGIVTPSYAGNEAFGSHLLLTDQEELFLKELFEDIENEEFVEEDLLDELDRGQVEILMYELSEEDLPIMEFFIKSAPENGYILLTPFRMPDRIHECIRI